MIHELFGLAQPHSISSSIYFSFFNKWEERKSWVELVSLFAEHYGRGRPITHHKEINQLFQIIDL